jgi:hypothetical protein
MTQREMKKNTVSLESRSEISAEFSSAVLEKGGEDQFDRSCGK